MASNYGSLLMVFVGLIFFVIGGYWIVSDILIQKNWRLASAQITFSDYTSDYDSDGSSYWPDIQYTYTFNSNSYSGDCCSTAMDNPDDAEKFTKSNYAGKTVKIYVNPSNPSESRLKDDLHPFSILNVFFAAFGAIFIIVGFAAFFTIK
ncbi:Uncharacterised protein [Candidatus Bilamarchaeum dharawalense]|uniref:DUF3592 domain-containing protein n=1 Tax=Candidatus Bilamarchaeum dharawalense TaxID=2885759 RepID=A0A5E4LNH4_9ARCH|nr:Uncharacterised protein [Candidatus Bilamarchaeum dharawalense]